VAPVRMTELGNGRISRDVPDNMDNLTTTRTLGAWSDYGPVNIALVGSAEMVGNISALVGSSETVVLPTRS
jgi:hypothetical protein